MVAGRGGPQGVRIEGYAAALAEAGGDAAMSSSTRSSPKIGGYRAAEAILAERLQPTAIFAANDLMAIGVMQALRERGLEIPRDIAVAGFDDISAARLVTPSLTTVAQFQYEIGHGGGRDPARPAAGRATRPIGTSREMPFRLIERQST